MTKLFPTSLVAVAAVTVTSWLTGIVSEAVDEDLFNILCDSMTPVNYDPDPIGLKNYPCPYKLVVKTNPVVPGDLVNITLSSVYKYMPFKAFMVQVRDDNDTVLGTFLSPCERQWNTEYHQVINCTNGADQNNTVIQLHHRFKPNDDITWLAPITLKDSVSFSFTVVYDEYHYWVNQKSEKIPVSTISEEDFRVKSYILTTKPGWYMEQFYRKNCVGPM